MEKLVLIDGNSLLNRAYYATPVFTTRDGLPTNGIFGFIKLLLKIISDKKPAYLAVAFDLHEPTFRHKMYGEYKAGRKPMPEDLVQQVPVLKDLLRLMNVKICELAGYEADDIIGTAAKRFPVQTYIYTGDRDAYQLVDETTNVCFTRKGVSDILELNQDNFKDETGLTPAQIVDLKALMGDKSDNIPGVRGIGEKTAFGLLKLYGSLKEIYAHAEEQVKSVKDRLLAGKEDAEFSYKLATIDTNVPLEFELSDCVLKMPFPKAAREKMATLEFKSFLTQPIFAEDSPSLLEEEINSNAGIHVEEFYPETVQEALARIEKAKGSSIACDITNKFLRFYIEDGSDTETVLPIKENLFDVGYYFENLRPVLERIFGGERTIILYNSKDVRHLLAEIDVPFVAPFEDVCMIRYIVEATGNSDTLEFCLNYYSLPTQNTAYGIFRLYEIYAKSMTDAESKLYFEVEKPLSVVLFDMEQTGVCVDDAILGELSARYNAELSSLVSKIIEEAGESFNLNSPTQLGKILFDKLKVGGDYQRKEKSKVKKNYSTAAEVLEQYADEYEIVRLILRYRLVQKLNSTYIDGFRPLIKSGKIHTTFNQMNTVTGRLSSSNPNLQNIPVRGEEGRELRKIFRASEGNVLIDADYSQIELRLLAHYSGCKELIEAYAKGEDIHALTASQVFGVSLDKVSSDMRREAKAVNFGIIYGISAFGLSKDLGISRKRAEEYINKYFATYTDVKDYIDKNVENAKANGYITTLFGRKRIINELKSSSFNVRSFGERAAMNMPLQGSSADIIKIAMVNVWKRLKQEGLKAKLILQVHDELIIDCPKEEVDKASEILKSEMENAVKLKVPLVAEVGIGKSWYEAK